MVLGKGSATTFGAHSWDAAILLGTAVPQALKKAQPGTKEFRAALRDATAQLELEVEDRKRVVESLTQTSTSLEARVTETDGALEATRQELVAERAGRTAAG